MSLSNELKQCITLVATLNVADLKEQGKKTLIMDISTQLCVICLCFL